MVEAMPELLKIKPELKIRVIGKGPSEKGIKDIISSKGLNDRFVFHGFVEKEETLFDIVSRCAIGICPWTNDADNNVIHQIATSLIDSAKSNGFKADNTSKVISLNMLLLAPVLK